jgi:tetratricopeptide (TPR) repeat protein
MQHTGIAQLFESGRTADGCPFFAMELVDGEPITRFGDAQRLPLAERLELFASVCEAVHHAHEQGVVHRDIKPANVLAKLQDGRPIAKVIDFGIAHSDDLQPPSPAILGTPGYVSPERQRGEGGGVAADVYSLGVLLHELVTGSAPRADVATTHPCSATLATKADAGAIAEARGLTQPQLDRECRRDLDWIAGKASAMQPTARYPSALTLAQDVRRYLDARPIQARAATSRYRLSRCWHRNRASMSAAAVAAIGLLVAGGIGVSGWLDRQRAHDSVDEASRMLVEHSIDDVLANLPGSDPARLELLRSGMHLALRALAQEPSDPGLQERVLRARTALGSLLVTLGRLDEAEELLRQVTRADVQDVDVALRMRAYLTLSSLLRRRDQLDESDAVLAAFASSYPVTGEDAWERRSLDAARHRELALNARQRQRPELALQHARTALALIADPPSDARRWSVLWKRVDMHKVAAELAAALPDEPYRQHFERAIESLQLLRQDYRRAKLDHLVALIYDSWAWADARHQVYDDIAEHDARALAALEPLLADFPGRVAYQETWLRVQRRRAIALRNGGDRQGAADRYDLALERGKRWLDDASDSRALTRLVAMIRRERDRLR